MRSLSAQLPTTVRELSFPSFALSPFSRTVGLWHLPTLPKLAPMKNAAHPIIPHGLGVVWLRNDLRCQDNPALSYALRHHEQVICLYVRGNETFPDGSAASVWREQALRDLNQTLRGKLWVSSEPVSHCLRRIDDLKPINGLYWNREYDPVAIERDTGLKRSLPFMIRQADIQSFRGDVLIEPWTHLNKQQRPYKVFTAFYKAGLAIFDAELSHLPSGNWQEKLQATPDDYRLGNETPDMPWAERLQTHMQADRSSGEALLEQFIQQRMGAYDKQRDFPADPGVSRLSSYLAHGQLSPREIVNAAAGHQGDAYIRQLFWRDFARYVLFHFPETPREPLDIRFSAMPWEIPGEALIRWQCGETGIPMVDAGMRELWATGYMHNRVRMIVASYLTKHLMIDWRFGAEWFMHTLFDADIANNTLGWQWTAGCGVDAAPYFRVFNPVTQGERFDPEGRYVQRWVPELRHLSAAAVHEPWRVNSAANSLFDSGRNSYPSPLVDLKFGRERALNTWDTIKQVANDSA